MKISLIITVYNRLPALQAIINALIAQKNPGDFEVIVADDGSTSEVAEWLQQQQHTPFPLRHVWQPDEGFRATKIRNQAAAKAEGEYLIFIDGDCIPLTSFFAKHRRLAQPNYFVSGNRVLLSQAFTEQVLARQLPIHDWGFTAALWAKWRGQCNRCLPLLSLPQWFVNRQYSKTWRGAKTCNLAMWREDFWAINGFDESYQGWGYEDSDLVIRLQRLGRKRKLGCFAVPVLHLWHPENDRSKQQDNAKALQEILQSQRVLAKEGVDQYFVIYPQGLAKCHVIPSIKA